MLVVVDDEPEDLSARAEPREVNREQDDRSFQRHGCRGRIAMAVDRPGCRYRSDASRCRCSAAPAAPWARTLRTGTEGTAAGAGSASPRGSPAVTAWAPGDDTG